MKQQKLNLWTPAKSHRNLQHTTTEIKKSQYWDKKVNREKYKNAIERLTTEINDKEKRGVDIPVLTGVSNWLTVLPITEFGFELSKQPFWDSIRLQYGWENMQSTNILSLR